MHLRSFQLGKGAGASVRETLSAPEQYRIAGIGAEGVQMMIIQKKAIIFDLDGVICFTDT